MPHLEDDEFLGISVMQTIETSQTRKELEAQSSLKGHEVNMHPLHPNTLNWKHIQVSRSKGSLREVSVFTPSGLWKFRV